MILPRGLADVEEADSSIVGRCAVSGRADQITGLMWLAGRRIAVDENAANVGGQIVAGTPKTHKRRSVMGGSPTRRSVQARPQS
jgi:hypothetical protein